MHWASHAIEKLSLGQQAIITPRGNSMQGKVESGSTVVVAPLKANPKKGDIVLVTVNGRCYLHLVVAVQGERYQIGNNKGGINGWVGRNKIHGIAISVNGQGV